MDCNGESEQVSLKMAQPSIEKFNHTVAQHLTTLRNHKSNISAAGSRQDWDSIKREQIDAIRVVRQLQFLTVEIDNVRNKVKDEERPRFDQLNGPARQSVMDGIADYLESQQKWQGNRMMVNGAAQENDKEESSHGAVGKELKFAPRLIVDTASVEAEVIRQRESCLQEMEHLQREVQDIQELYETVHTMVNGQGEMIDEVEENVTVTQTRVEEGEAALKRAVSYKRALYPLYGAILGTCIAGPVGLVVGLKAGGLAAIGGGVVGLAGGKYMNSEATKPVVSDAASDSAD